MIIGKQSIYNNKKTELNEWIRKLLSLCTIKKINTNDYIK